ncbi:MAG TPA: TonB-dependent receptor [Bryobacteraceae bacterium]|nr:TonB-dependent receptor [Bryobacteraceae bacterium]
MNYAKPPRAALRFIGIMLIFGAPAAAAQDMTIEWKASLTDLERRLPGLPAAGPAVDAWRADAESLRSSLASAADSYPAPKIQLPEPLPPEPSHAQLQQQFAALSSAVDQAIRQSPGSPFHLGTVAVTVSATAPAPSPVSDSTDQTEIRNLDLVNAAKALDYLPGVSIQHLSQNRNEAGIMVRGFSTRGQVPLYIDGIPISVPYDGYVDFNRFLTSDIAEVQVAKGYSSPLLGPNALGGTINLVTQEPVKKIDVDALIGTGSGNTLLSALRLGSRWRRFFFQGALDWLQADFIPLSGKFPVLQYRNLPDIVMTDHLNNSWSRDERFTGRAGWTPRGQDEYVLSYINLKGQKGVPLYQGPNTAAAYRFFWTWPYWDMANYYFHSNTELGESSAIKFRAFYTQFRNDIDMYSTDTYSVMNTSNAEHSMYNEHNDGFSSEFTTRAVSRNVISASFFLKDDIHTERGIFPAISPFPLIEPELRDSDIQTTIGLQDVVRFSSRLSLTGGFSADHFDGLEGQQYNAAMTGLLPFTCLESPKNTSFSGCTAHVWNLNPQVAVSYRVGESGTFFATFADRGRFPMLKDIYSASLGAGLPNPNLQPEHSRNWNAGYSQVLGARTLARVTLFRSDLRDAIESVFVTDPGGTSPSSAMCPNNRVIGFCSEMANIGREVHEGVEFEVRSTPLARLTVNASYSFLNRTIAYDFGALPNVSAVNTSISVLPVSPRNKAIGTATVRLPLQILAIVNERYESGLVVQDTTYATTSPLFLPHAESYATTDIGAIAPVRGGISVQAGIKNLFDRYYFYTAGYPEIGRNWFLNLRYRF